MSAIKVQRTGNTYVIMCFPIGCHIGAFDTRQDAEDYLVKLGCTQQTLELSKFNKFKLGDGYYSIFEVPHYEIEKEEILSKGDSRYEES